MDQVVTLNNGAVAGDTNETANSYAKRDTNGDTRNHATTSSVQTVSEGSDAHGISSSQTANFTADKTKGLWMMDTTGGAVTGTLSLATNFITGSRIGFSRVNTGGSTCSIAPGAGDTINGATTTLTIGSQYGCLFLTKVGGTAWLKTGSL